MRSIKPGRGPSGMGAVASIFVALFGVIWTLATIRIGAPFFFSLFGILFVGLAIVQGIYHFKNATGKNRYSSFDITEDGEEPDPLNQRFGEENPYAGAERKDGTAAAFCPYCGEPVDGAYEYCPKCGKKLPD